MDIINIVLNALLLVSVVLVSLFMKSFLPRYFEKKAENLATKEDIEVITDKVENIKYTYLVEVERLKSSFSLFADQERMVSQNRNDALINYFEKSLEY